MFHTLKTILKNINNDGKISKARVDTKAKMKIYLRTFLYLSSMIKLQKLYEKYNLDSLLKGNIDLYNKMHYPLLNKDFNNQTKLKYLDNHFKIISKLKSDALTEIYSDNGMLLVDMSAYNIPINIKLKNDPYTKKEGDITIYLETQNPINKIFKITGLLSEETLYIGCVQGQTTKEQIQQLTKEFFGMRPHNFLLYCIMEFAKNLGCKNLYAIKNDFHVSKATAKTRERISFDYNEFFKELNLISETKSWSVIDINYPLKDISEIKSKKRSMYRKRYALLENISKDIAKKVEEIKV